MADNQDFLTPPGMDNDETSNPRSVDFESLTSGQSSDQQKMPIKESVREDDVVVRTFFPRESGYAPAPPPPDPVQSAIADTLDEETREHALPDPPADEELLGTSFGSFEPAEPTVLEHDTRPQTPDHTRTSQLEARVDEMRRARRQPEPRRGGCVRRLFATSLLLLSFALLGLSIFLIANPGAIGQVEVPAVASDLLALLTPPSVESSEVSRTAVPTATIPEGALLEPTERPALTETPGIGVTRVPSDEESEEEETPEPGDDDTTVALAGIDMLLVSGGTFLMGENIGGVESPAHEVTLDPFYISQTEVTNAQWAECVADGDCTEPSSTLAYDETPYYGEAAFDDYPVIYVSWFDAEDFCAWQGGRLPTEAEWEMAARWDPETGDVAPYPWGNGWDADNVNFCDASCLLSSFATSSTNDGFPQMAPVGSFPDGASRVGALDMAGNVAEWVADWFSPTYYAQSPEANPTGPSSGTLKVLRGGAWGVGDRLLLTTYSRSRFSPDSEAAGLGLRCAVSADDLD